MSAVHLTPGGSAYARERFLETFGPLNGRVDLGNHTLVWIDAPGYLDETEHAPSRYQDPTYDATNGGVIEHLQHIAKRELMAVIIMGQLHLMPLHSQKQVRKACHVYCSRIYRYIDRKALHAARFANLEDCYIKSRAVSRASNHSRVGLM